MAQVAIVGTAPSSRLLAPFADPHWQIWGVGPGNLQPESKIPRCDVWFELHPFAAIAREPSYTHYLGELAKIPKVYLQKQQPSLPNSVEYPLQRMLDRYGPYFFTSSFSYMIALAIEELTNTDAPEKRLGFYGVDCSATEEYGLQRPGAHFFFMKAREAGIDVVLPPESDLLQPPGLYGYVENDPWFVKQMARKKEVEAALGLHMARAREAAEIAAHYRGILEDIQWNTNTWAGRRQTEK